MYGNFLIYRGDSTVNNSKGRTCKCATTDLTFIVSNWTQLQPHIREAIITLVDGALASGRVDTKNGSQDASEA